MFDLTEKEISDFQYLYKHYYKQTLSIEEAKVKIFALVDILKLVLKYKHSQSNGNDPHWNLFEPKRLEFSIPKHHNSKTK